MCWQVMYCSVPKVACTNWRRLLLFLSGKVKAKSPADIHTRDVHGKYKFTLPALSSFSSAEAQHRLKNYYKVSFKSRSR
jgi:chondroitin 4-sulfotransferase 11